MPFLLEVTMETRTIALFGEAEKGDYKTAYLCRSLEELANSFGNPPVHSRGLDYAVQALLYRCQLLFIRVREEGFSEQDYFAGVHLLKIQEAIPSIMAICMPGVGNGEIINAVIPICQRYNSILVISEADLYDYITSYRAA
jgi:hypothetical protein